MALVIIILAAINIRQYNRCKPNNQNFERDTVTVIVKQSDTVYRQIMKYYSVERPVPVLVHDTVYSEVSIKEYRDTVIHEFGKIFRTEWVKGELLKKDIFLEIKIPTITETITSTQTITNTVRSPLLFATGGFRTSYQKENSIRSPDIRIVPSIGLYGVSEGHKWSAGVDFGFDRQLTAKIGYRISR